MLWITGVSAWNKHGISSVTTCVICNIWRTSMTPMPEFRNTIYRRQIHIVFVKGSAFGMNPKIGSSSPSWDKIIFVSNFSTLSQEHRSWVQEHRSWVKKETFHFQLFSWGNGDYEALGRIPDSIESNPTPRYFSLRQDGLKVYKVPMQSVLYSSW